MLPNLNFENKRDKLVHAFDHIAKAAMNSGLYSAYEHFILHIIWRLIYAEKQVNLKLL